MMLLLRTPGSTTVPLSVHLRMRMGTLCLIRGSVTLELSLSEVGEEIRD